MSSFPHLGYPPKGTGLESPFGGDVLPTGLPSLVPSTPMPPQYSNMGRMLPEFLDPSDDPSEANQDEEAIVAQGRAIKILGYGPTEGTGNTRIVIRLLFRRDRIPRKTHVSLRVKMGNIPLMTAIRGIEPGSKTRGEWQLHVTAPDPVELNVVGLDVPLIVQMCDVNTKTIIDDVCIGSFRFWAHPSAGELHSSESMPFDSEAHMHDIPDSVGLGIHGSAHPTIEEAVPSGCVDSPHHLDDSMAIPGHSDMQDSMPGGSAHEDTWLPSEGPSYETLGVSKSLGHDSTSPTIVRNLPPTSQKPVGDTYPGSLQLHGDLNSMTKDWSPEEVQNNRRMVEFFCVQTRGCIDITFAPVDSHEARDTSKVIVSCIWWSGKKDYIITSVDTINLLERLVKTKFSTDEKNRIRRNLQGFKPETVSKHNEHSRDFFQTLMDFPAPRPRNIEKDVKAFSWSKLPKMLEKVISKYWFITSSGDSDSDDQGSASQIKTGYELDSTPTGSPTATGSSLPITSISSSLPQSQDEGFSTSAGVPPESNSLISSAEDRKPTHSGLFEDPEFHEDTTAAHDVSIYGHSDSPTGLNESCAENVHGSQIGQGHTASQYQGHMPVYSEGTELSPPGGGYPYTRKWATQQSPSYGAYIP